MKKRARQMFIRANARRKIIRSASQSTPVVYLRSVPSNRAGAGTHNCCRTLQYTGDVQKYKLLQCSRRIDRADAEQHGL